MLSYGVKLLSVHKLRGLALSESILLPRAFSLKKWAKREKAL